MPHDTLSATQAGTEGEIDSGSAVRITNTASSDSHRHGHGHHFGLEHTTSIERVTSSVFVLGQTRSRSRGLNRGRRGGSWPRASYTHVSDLPQLSSRVTIGRNSQFHGLTVEERETLGGMEYRSLKLLFWISMGKLYSSLVDASSTHDLRSEEPNLTRCKDTSLLCIF
jgi:hypothetical protein